MVTNKLHIKSWGAPHPDLVVSEPLNLTDQRGCGICPLFFHLCPRETSILITLHLHCGYSPAGWRKPDMTVCSTNLVGAKIPPPNLWEEFPM